MSTIKVEYSYTEYKDYPIATMISQDRARNSIYLSSFALLGIIISAILFIACGVTEGDWSGIWLFLIFIAFFVYMIWYYPKVTEKKIQKAISEQIQLQYELANSRYKCKSIMVSSQYSTGKCVECGLNNSRLTLCKIKSDISTKDINICSNCILKYQSNLTKK